MSISYRGREFGGVAETFDIILIGVGVAIDWSCHLIGDHWMELELIGVGVAIDWSRHPGNGILRFGMESELWNWAVKKFLGIRR